jgi:hypothetical protein
MSDVEYPPIPANNPLPGAVTNSEPSSGLLKNGLKAGGLAVVVFVAWTIGAFVLMSQQHIGQVYDPTIGAWFVDTSADSQSIQAAWLGQAMSFGFIVALVAGALFFFRKGLARLAK